MSAGTIFSVLMFLFISTLSLAAESNLPAIAVIPVFDDSENNYSMEELLITAENVFSESGRFRVVDVTSHELYIWEPEDQTIRLQTIAADMSVDLFMLMDVSVPQTDERELVGDSILTSRSTSIDITGRFYSSGGGLLGSVRERRRQGFTGSTSMDIGTLALNGVREVAERSLAEIFPFEFTFTAGPGPELAMPVGTAGGVTKGMVFSVIARSDGIPRSSQEYRALGSHGILQITDAGSFECRGTLIAGTVIEGARVTAIESPAPAILSLSYTVLPTEVVPGDNLTGEEAETSQLMSQAEFGGETGKWGLSLGGFLYSGVVPRMSSIGIRGEAGARIPVVAPSLALRSCVGFEAAFLSQNTRADSISSSASTATIAGTASLDLEWLFSGRFGLHAGCTGRIGTAADSWGVQSSTGYNRDALPGELYYAEIKQAPVSFSAGLTYMIY